MAITVPDFAELAASPAWETVDFISDLHLCESQPATFDAWQRYMHSTTAGAVFILGDLFEMWVGDDCIRPDLTPTSSDLNFEERCARVLQDTGHRLDVYLMHGNRDFMLGPAMASTCHARLLQDPTVLSVGQQRVALSHGDQLCLADTRYLAFRAMVRDPAWQQAQLAKPLRERQTLGRQMRLQSQSSQNSDLAYADVDDNATLAWLQAMNATTLIHGHTHKPATHDLDQGLQRIVLTDWDANAKPKRAEVLRLSARGYTRIATL